MVFLITLLTAMCLIPKAVPDPYIVGTHLLFLEGRKEEGRGKGGEERKEGKEESRKEE